MEPLLKMSLLKILKKRASADAPDDIERGDGKPVALKGALFGRFTKRRSAEAPPSSDQAMSRTEDSVSQVALAAPDHVTTGVGKVDTLKKALFGRFIRPRSPEVLPPPGQATSRTDDSTSQPALVSLNHVTPDAGKLRALKKTLFGIFTRPQSPKVLPPSSQAMSHAEDSTSQPALVTPVDVTPGDGKLGALKKAKKALFGRFAKPRSAESTRRISLDDVARVAGEPGSLKKALVGGFLKPVSAEARPLWSRAVSRFAGIAGKVSPGLILVRLIAEKWAMMRIRKCSRKWVVSLLVSIVIASLILLVRFVG